MALVMPSESVSMLKFAFAAIVLYALTAFLTKLYVWRRRMLQLQRRGLPMPPYNAILGHLPVLARIVSKLPSDAHGMYLSDQIRRAYPNLGPVFYVDGWPFAPPILVVSSPETLYQMTQEHPLPKFPNLKKFLEPLCDGLDIVTMEGPTWKRWRGIFNPGFSASHLITIVPDLVTEAETFCDILRQHAQNADVFQMKPLTDNLAMDIIGRVVLDTQLRCQQTPNEMVDAVRSQIRWLSFGAEPNLLQRYHPLRPFVHWLNRRKMNKHVSRVLDSRFMDYKEGDVDKRSRSVIDLALKAYTDEREESGLNGKMDATFRAIAMAQLKIFLFAGHDTTSSSICYLFYLLSQHPAALKQLRAEHTDVFGADATHVASQLRCNPHLLNKLPYTVAVIKESLRLFPVATSVRAGDPSFVITDALGRHFETDGFLVWSNPQTIHRDPAYWPKPDVFIPERWLVPTDDPLHPVKGAWRAFEHGPRNCIGQELAMLEMKLVLVMVMRAFEICPAYDELDRETGHGKKRAVEGERAYQVQLSQPEGDLPCRIKAL